MGTSVFTFQRTFWLYIPVHVQHLPQRKRLGHYTKHKKRVLFVVEKAVLIVLKKDKELSMQNNRSLRIRRKWEQAGGTSTQQDTPWPNADEDKLSLSLSPRRKPRSVRAEKRNFHFLPPGKDLPSLTQAIERRPPFAFGGPPRSLALWCGRAKGGLGGGCKDERAPISVSGARARLNAGGGGRGRPWDGGGESWSRF